MFKEFENPRFWEREFFWEISQTSHEAATRGCSRILFENLNIPIRDEDLPIGGEEGLTGILNFMPEVKDGFHQNLKTDFLFSDEIEPILKKTPQFEMEAVWDELEAAGIGVPRTKLEVDRIGRGLFKFRWTLATFVYLSQKGRVNFNKLGYEGNDVINQTRRESFWHKSLTLKNILGLIEEIEQTTNLMIFTSSVDIKKDSVLKTAHFFAASYKLAEDFL